MATLPASGATEDAARTVAQTKENVEAIRDVVSTLLGGAPGVELTLSSGTVTPAVRDHGGRIRLDTEGDDPTDDLDRIIQTNCPEGTVLILSLENASRVVTLKHGHGGAGEMLLTGAADLALVNVNSWVEFQRRSTSWVETARRIVVGDHAETTSEGRLGAVTYVTASGNWTHPEGLRFVEVEVQAPGGGGGGVDGQGGGTNGQAGGGGGGRYDRKRIMAADLGDGTAGSTETCTIGAVGAAGSAAAGNGGTGGTTSFGAHIVCLGGEGGTGATGTASAAAVAGGAGGAASTPGDFGISGQNGQFGLVTGGARILFGNGGDAHLGHGGQHAVYEGAAGQRARVMAAVAQAVKPLRRRRTSPAAPERPASSSCTSTSDQRASTSIPHQSTVSLSLLPRTLPL